MNERRESTWPRSEAARAVSSRQHQNDVDAAPAVAQPDSTITEHEVPLAAFFREQTRSEHIPTALNAGIRAVNRFLLGSKAWTQQVELARIRRLLKRDREVIRELSKRSRAVVGQINFALQCALTRTVAFLPRSFLAP